MAKEITIVQTIIAELNKLPACYVRKTHGSRYALGWPDIIGSYGGRCLALEVKKPGEQPTALQAHELAKWRASEAIAGVVTSWDDVRKLLML